MSDDGAFYDVLTTHSASQFRIADFDVQRGRATSVPIDPGEEYFSSNSRAQAEWSPDGRSLALLRRTGPDPMGILISVLGPDGARLRDVRPQLDGFGPFVWSRDGKSFLAPGHELKGRAGIVRVDASSGAGRVIAGESDSPGGLAVLGDLAVLGESPDSRYLYYAATDVSRLRLIAHEMATQVQREIATLPGGDQPRVAGFWNPHLSPDGRHIAASVWQEEGGRALEIIAVASGARRRLTSGNDNVLTWAPDSRSVLVQRSLDGSRQVHRLSIDTGEAALLDWNLEGESHSFRVHPDGRRIIYVLLASSGTAQLRRLTGIPAQLQDKR
jgi:hypothetical protein